MIAFIQACSINSLAHGGSARILRALLDTEHPPVICINTHFSATASYGENEVPIPSRPDFGRLEHTRLSGSLGLLDSIYNRRFAARLRRTLRGREVKAIHLLVSTYSLVPVHGVASDLGLPYFLTLHDDMEYVSRGHALMKQMMSTLSVAWREAKGVYVISDALGQEYCRRFGARDYSVVTDGLKTIPAAPQARPEKSLRLYFMGLFHNTYAQNLRAVLDALKIVRSNKLDWDISVTCRCGEIPLTLREGDVPVEVLPFAPQETLEKDMRGADLLYQPMPFQKEARAFSRFSLSTKMITYLGSGLPIFYHGPRDAAAGQLLIRHQAAVVCDSLDPRAIADRLMAAIEQRESIVNHALSLARSQFMLADQQRRFWEPILTAL
jgi:hypothetical protein